MRNLPATITFSLFALGSGLPLGGGAASAAQLLGVARLSDKLRSADLAPTATAGQRFNDIEAAPPGVGAPAAPRTAEANGAEPWKLVLWYADGGPVPDVLRNGYCGDGGPPGRFVGQCGSSREDCIAKVESYLAEFEAPFNIIVTHTLPTVGDTHFFGNVVTDQGGAFCHGKTSWGTAWFDCDKQFPGSTANTFVCNDAKKCACAIAEESAHLVGLRNTQDPDGQDVMSAGCDHWVDEDLPAPGCSKPTQNSYREMLGFFGPWPGGPKPDSTGPAPEPTGPVTCDSGGGPEPQDRAGGAAGGTSLATRLSGCLCGVGGGADARPGVVSFMTGTLLFAGLRRRRARHAAERASATNRAAS